VKGKKTWGFRSEKTTNFGFKRSEETTNIGFRGEAKTNMGFQE
jgi:hypothetical protein